MGAEGLQTRWLGEEQLQGAWGSVVAPAEWHGQFTAPLWAFLYNNKKSILAFKVVEASKWDLSPKQSLLSTYYMQSLFWPCRSSSGHCSWNRCSNEGDRYSASDYKVNYLIMVVITHGDIEGPTLKCGVKDRWRSNTWSEIRNSVGKTAESLRPHWLVWAIRSKRGFSAGKWNDHIWIFKRSLLFKKKKEYHTKHWWGCGATRTLTHC